jgi:hypothetical protein
VEIFGAGFPGSNNVLIDIKSYRNLKDLGIRGYLPPMNG